MLDGMRAAMDEIGVASLVLFRFVVAMLRGGSADLLHHVCGAWVPSARRFE